MIELRVNTLCGHKCNLHHGCGAIPIYFNCEDDISNLVNKVNKIIYKRKSKVALIHGIIDHDDNDEYNYRIRGTVINTNKKEIYKLIDYNRKEGLLDLLGDTKSKIDLLLIKKQKHNRPKLI